FFFQAEDGIRDRNVTGVQTCALPIYRRRDDQAAGRDRGQGAVGSRLQGRPGDGCVALPARRGRRREALGRRAAPGRALPAPPGRSEERRVGKEWGWRCGAEGDEEKEE